MMFQCRMCKADFYGKPSKTRRFCSESCYHGYRYSKTQERISSGRRCTRCKAIKPADGFYTAGTKNKSADNRARWCKECRRDDERLRRANPRLIAKHHDKYESDVRYRARILIGAISKRCKKRGLPFDIDIDWLADKLRGRCELTGLSFDMTVRTRKPQLYTPSIDRIIPGHGYTKANCRVVLMGVNLWLKDFTLEAMLPIAAALISHNAKRYSLNAKLAVPA